VYLCGVTSNFSQIDTLANNQGVFALSDGRTFNTTGPLISSGTQDVGAGSTMVINGNYSPTAKALTHIDGTLTVKGSATLAGTLTGSGKFSASKVRTGGAKLSPGNSPGTLLIDGDLFVDDGTEYLWQIDAAGSDLVQVGGTLEFDAGAVLHVTLESLDETPVPSSIKLFAYGSLAGSLTASQFTVEGYSFSGLDLSNNSVTLTGVQTTVPEAATLAMLMLGGIVLLRRRC
jgi:hypothetical protein